MFSALLRIGQVADQIQKTKIAIVSAYPAGTEVSESVIECTRQGAGTKGAQCAELPLLVLSLAYEVRPKAYSLHVNQRPASAGVKR